MKTISNLRLLFTVCCLIGLVGCTNDELIAEQPATFTIEVQAEAFNSQTPTRVVEEGYKTVFKGGEQIGITAVKGGAVYAGMNNIPFTYNAATNAWQLSNNTLPQLYYYPDVTYIAYYPYDAAMSNKKSEQEIIDAFTPQTDQSTYAAYTASDLMTGEATVSAAGTSMYTLSFQLAHRMTLMIIYPRGQHYQATDGYDFYAPPKEVTTLKVRSTTAAYEPGDCTYRAIVAPGAVDVAIDYVTVEDAALQYKGKVTAEAGKYHEVLLAPKSPVLPYTISPGDYFFVDGGLLPHNIATLSETNKKYCVGIVFHAGAGQDDSFANYSAENMTGPDIHGYVVALKDAYPSDTDKKWGPRSQFFGNGETTQFNGYAKRSYADNGDWRCQAAAEIRNFRIAVPAPAMATNWYLPSLAQLQAVWNVYKHSGGNPVYDSLQKAGGELFADQPYWSVTELKKDDVYLFLMQSGGGSSSGKCSGYDMNWGWNAYYGIHLTRVVLTF